MRECAQTHSAAQQLKSFLSTILYSVSKWSFSRVRLPYAVRDAVITDRKKYPQLGRLLSLVGSGSVLADCLCDIVRLK